MHYITYNTSYLHHWQLQYTYEKGKKKLLAGGGEERNDFLVLF